MALIRLRGGQPLNRFTTSAVEGNNPMSVLYPVASVAHASLDDGPNRGIAQAWVYVFGFLNTADASTDARVQSAF